MTGMTGKARIDPKLMGRPCTITNGWLPNDPLFKSYVRDFKDRGSKHTALSHLGESGTVRAARFMGRNNRFHITLELPSGKLVEVEAGAVVFAKEKTHGKG